MRSEVSQSQSHRKLDWTGFSLVPWALGFIRSSLPGTHGSLQPLAAAVAMVEKRRDTPNKEVAMMTPKRNGSLVLEYMVACLG